MPDIKYVIFSLLLVFSAQKGHSQTPTPDTLQVINTALQVADSLGVLDSLIQHPEVQSYLNDSQAPPPTTLGDLPKMIPNDTTLYQASGQAKGDVETTIDYQSKDSIFFDLTSQEMHLYGESKIVYGDITLTAERIGVDWVNNTLEANFIIDDSTGRKIGKPVFQEGGDTYETDDMIYNIKTRRALINGIITEQDGAIMHGERVKKNERDELFIRQAKYTTCDLAEPHFHIQSSKLKVIPNDKVLSGPFNLHFGDIPTPLGFLFGMFPQPREKASGIIFPSYGEDATRGFFLRQFGYYFDINDYMDLKLTGDLYSKGSWGVMGVTNYRVRYKFSGNMRVRYNKTVSVAFEDDSFSKDFWVDWSHSPQSYGTSRFSASVSGGTSTFTQNNNNVGLDYNSNVNAQFSSNVSYSKTFRGTPFSMQATARHSQNISTGQVSMTLPELSVNATRITPFKNVPGMEKNALGKLGFSYRMAMKNELTNAPVSASISGAEIINENPLNDSLVNFSLDNISVLMDRAKQGIRHQIPVTTSFNILNNFTVSPSFNYTEVWYSKELSYEYIEELEGVRVDTLNGFSRAGWWSTGASMSTRLYGFFPVGGEKIQAIRHVMTPNVGISYTPDNTDPSKGVYQEVQINEEGDTRILSKYERFAYGGPTGKESATMSFSLNNNIEMKVKTKNDSIDEYKKVKVFDNLSVSSGYDFLRDSMNLNKINWNARTSFFNSKVSLNLSGTIDPYIYILDSIQERSGGDVVHDTRVNQLAWNSGQGIGQLERLTMAIGMNLSPKGKSAGAQKDKYQQNSPGDNLLNPEDNFVAGDVNQFIATDANQYVPFDVGWSLRANYQFNYTRVGFEEANITQTLQFGGSFQPTSKTNVNVSSGYDLEKKEFTFTNINVSRDLHCWAISFNWVPFGPRQSYFVSINVKSALLKDLKLDKRNQNQAQVF